MDANGCNGTDRMTHARRCRAALMAPLAIVLALAGCAGSNDTKEIVSSRTVAIEEFSNADLKPAADAQAPSSSTSVPGADAAPPSATNSTPVGAASTVAPSTAQANRDAPRMMVPGDEMVVESVIGQVSGRPIFADELLEPIADQLRSEAERLAPDAFVERAREIIHRHLSQVILNELFLAEAEASLTPQEQMGLLAFLKDLQEKSIAERGGTIFGASKRIAVEEDMTLEEFEQAQKDRTLIQKLLIDRVSPRVIVSWRDVQREYELRKSEFNPPATVTLRRLELSTAEQKEVIEQVKTKLAAEASFDSVVSELSLSESVSYLGQDGRLTLPAEGLGALEVADALRTALGKVKLEAGQTTQAIERGGGTLWLNIQSIDQPPPKTLFDVQQQLIGELQGRRFEEERDKYIRSLLQKGIFDELNEMVARALAVAILRYGR